jgi:hypothetical protein
MGRRKDRRGTKGTKRRKDKGKTWGFYRRENYYEEKR